MAGETDLDTLLREMSPRLNDGCFVYTRVSTDVRTGVDPIATVREQEGLTLVIAQEQADELGLTYDFVTAWITLEVHSARDAVGLTAAISRALTAWNISAKVVAGYAHDHVFVPYERAADVMSALLGLTTA